MPSRVDTLKGLLQKMVLEMRLAGYDSLVGVLKWLERNVEIPPRAQRISVDLALDIEAEDLASLEKEIRAFRGVESVLSLSQRDTYEEAYILAEHSPEYRDTLSVDDFGPSFEIVVRGTEFGNEVADQLRTNPLVVKVDNPGPSPLATMPYPLFLTTIDACS
jgi:cell division protein FtsX